MKRKLMNWGQRHNLQRVFPQFAMSANFASRANSAS